KVIRAREFFDREGFEILQRALVPHDLDAGLLLPDRRAGEHRVVAARMAPRHALQRDRAHRPNSSRMAALCSPMRGAARGNFGRSPLTRIGERVVTIETLSS